jgi:hypothetical protein
VNIFFLRFGGGRPLHKVHSFIFCNATDDSAVRFAFSSLKIVCSIVGCICRLLSGFFIPILPCSFCSRPLPLMALLDSVRIQGLIPDVRPLWFLDATLSSVHSLCLCLSLLIGGEWGKSTGH